MDLLPIKPNNNLIRPATGTANDGGSKSQGGYINVRSGQQEKIIISDESKRLIGEDPVVDEKSLFLIIKEFVLKFFKLFRNIIKNLNFKLPKKIKKQESQKSQKIEENKETEKSEVKNFLGFTRHISE